MDEEKECSCRGRKTERTEEERRRLVNRLSRIEGQIRGLRGMVERNAYCPDILVQSSAVSAAINSFNRDLIAAHIKGCVVRDVKQGDEDVIDELIDTVRRLMK